MGSLDPLFKAIVYFNQRNFEKSVEEAGKILAKNPYDEAAWIIKMRSLTEQVYVDEVENEEEGMAESMLDDNPIAAVPRPGTSLSVPKTAQKGQGPSQSIRPRTNTGRPLSGFVRPGTRSQNLNDALGAPRTAKTARPVTSSTGRFVRLGTASMLSNPDGPFINVSRLNLSKYGNRPDMAKPLFEYLFYHENDIRNALQLASIATQAVNYKDWYWKVQLGKCYYRLGMYREAEKQFRSAYQQESTIEVILLLGKVYVRLDQPISALDTYKKGLETHPNDVHLITALARIHEGVNDLGRATDAYRLVLKMNSINVEAIACIATNYFYNDQPEVALRYFRRLLQMGVSNAELYTNISLCCFYSHQWDLAVGCVDKAIGMADDTNSADIWFNVGHIALGGGDTSMAYQCFRLSLAMDNGHPESCCNLAVLEMRKGNSNQAKTLLKSAMQFGSHMFEPFYNYALLCEQLGEFQASYVAVIRALEIFPEHADSQMLKRKIDQLLYAV